MNRQLVIFLLLFPLCFVTAQESAQEFAAKLDQTLEIPQGVTFASLSHFHAGKSKTYQIQIHRKNDYILYHATGNRGEEVKILYREQNVFFHNIMNGTIRKNDTRLRVLNTAFTTEDLRMGGYEAGYVPLILAPKTLKNILFYRISFTAQSPGAYEKIIVLLYSDNKLPYRIEFYNKSGEMEKKMIFSYDKIKFKNKTSTTQKEKLARLDITDLKNGNSSVLKFLLHNQGIIAADGLFELPSLKRK